ncbi:MAG: hypothetical protein KGS72_11190 [Cyanobacteria bacterium REEB67]|nr:hypothetical protein [Cyanobacteria bacterium REEB67]
MNRLLSQSTEKTFLAIGLSICLSGSVAPNAIATGPVGKAGGGAAAAPAGGRGAVVGTTGGIVTSKGVVDAIVLKETSTFVGPVEMTVSDGGIKFAMSKMGLVWMTYPPKWDGYAYNPESKSYLIRPHSEWKKKLFNLPSGKKSLEDGPKFTVKDTGKKETIEGYVCRKEALISGPSKKRKPGEPTKSYCAGNIWVADDFPAPKEVGELMSNFVKVEVKKGIVLKAEMLKPGSFTEYKPVFETLKITRKKVPASVFDPPKNFKLVTSELQLMMGDADSDAPGMGGMSTGGSIDTDALLKKLK